MILWPGILSMQSHRAPIGPGHWGFCVDSILGQRILVVSLPHVDLAATVDVGTGALRRECTWPEDTCRFSPPPPPPIWTFKHFSCNLLQW